MNGWIRLWVFISITWATLIGSIWFVDQSDYIFQRKYHSVWDLYEFNASLPMEEMGYVVITESSEPKLMASLNKEVFNLSKGVFRFDIDSDETDGIPKEIWKNWDKYINGPRSEQSIYLLRNWWKKATTYALRHRDESLAFIENLNKERWLKIIESTKPFAWLISLPILILLAFGVGVAWVRRGFSKSQ